MSKFEGFETPNTTPVPDIVFDELLEKLTGNELKALLYIIRRTYGFGKNADAISLSQFRKGITTQDGKVLDRGCGIRHNRTILEALESLEKKGYIASRKRTTNAGDSDTTVYKMRFKMASEAQSDSEVVTPSNHVVTSGNDGSYPTSLPSLPDVTRVVTSRNPQETVLQDTDSQETVQQESDTALNAPTPARASSSAELLSESAKLRAIVNAGINHLDGEEPDPEETVRNHPRFAKGDINGVSDRGAAGQHHGFGVHVHGETHSDQDNFRVSPAGSHGSLPERDTRRREGDGTQVAPAQTVRGAEPSPSHSTDGAVSALLSPAGTPPRTSEQSGPRASGAGDGPPPTLNRKQHDRLIEKTIAAYWTVIEAWKGQRYSQDQRSYDKHRSGIEAMYTNGVTPETLKAKLKLLDDFQRKTFTVNRLYLEWWNNLDEQAKPAQNGNRPAPRDESRPRRRDFSKEYEQGVMP